MILITTFFLQQFAQAVGQFWGVMALCLSDDPVLPFSVPSYASTLAKHAAQLNSTYGNIMTENGLHQSIGL